MSLEFDPPRPPSSRTAVWLILAAAAAPWIVLCLLFPPARQQFPLVDDWSYAHTAFTFAREHRIDYNLWAAIPLLGQIVWAWPFVELFGANHFSLRLSTIVLSLLGTGAVYTVMRSIPLRPFWAGAVAVCVAWNPLTVLCVGSFMSDAPAFYFGFIGMALAIAGLHRRSCTWYVGALVVLLFAVTTRQTAAAAVAAIFIEAFMLARRKSISFTLPAGAAMVCVVAVVTHAWFLKRSDVTLPGAAALPRFARAVWLTHSLLVYGGLAALPLAVLRRPRGREWAVIAGVFVVLFFLSTKYWVQGGRLFPYLSDTVTAFGQSPADAPVLGHRPRVLPVGVCIALTIAGCFGLAMLSTNIPSAIRRSVTVRLLLWYSGLQYLLLLIQPNNWDRYLIVFFPFLLAVSAMGIGPALPRRKYAAAIAIAMALLLAPAASLMYDRLSFNDARWRLCNRALVECGLKPTELDGGFEWDGWFSTPALRRAATKSHASTQPNGRLVHPLCAELFPYLPGEYAVATTVLPHTQIIDTEPYRTFWPPGMSQLYILRARPVAANAAK